MQGLRAVDDWCVVGYTTRLMAQTTPAGEQVTNQPIRTSMGFKDDVMPILAQVYASPLIEHLKENGFRLRVGDITICLAEEFGFCYGVDRAVILAYETRKMFPKKRIFLTSEIIHNPQVNAKLKEDGVLFLDDPELKGEGYDSVGADDVVIIPAFGTAVKDLVMLQQKGTTLVDTTCGSVMNVWKRVARYAKDGFTSVIHGKYDHEETNATSSRTGGKYVIVRDLNQAKKVCAYILKRISKEELLSNFNREAFSVSFEPERDLENT